MKIFSRSGIAFMKYIVVCLIRGKAKRDHLRLTKAIASTFHVVRPLRIPPHITLKYTLSEVTPRRTKELEGVLKEFCKKQRADKVNLSGFNHFGNKVVYVKVKLLSGAFRVFRSLIKTLELIEWVNFEKHEGLKLTFHATLAFTRRRNFHAVWDYLSEKKYV